MPGGNSMSDPRVRSPLLTLYGGERGAQEPEPRPETVKPPLTRPDTATPPGSAKCQAPTGDAVGAAGGRAAVSSGAGRRPHLAGLGDRSSRPHGPARADLAGRVPLSGADHFGREPVEAVVADHLVRIFHRDVLVAEHVQRRKPDTEPRQRVQGRRTARQPTSGMTVTRVVDGAAQLSFAGTRYRV